MYVTKFLLCFVLYCLSMLSLLKICRSFFVTKCDSDIKRLQWSKHFITEISKIYIKSIVTYRITIARNKRKIKKTSKLTKRDFFCYQNSQKSNREKMRITKILHNWRKFHSFFLICGDNWIERRGNYLTA